MSEALAIWRRADLSREWGNDSEGHDQDSGLVVQYQRKRRTVEVPARAGTAKRQVAYENAVRSRLILERKWSQPHLSQRAHYMRSGESRHEVKDPLYPQYLVKYFAGGIIVILFGLFYMLVSNVFFNGEMNEVCWIVLACGGGIVALSLLKGESSVEDANRK